MKTKTLSIIRKYEKEVEKILFVSGLEFEKISRQHDISFKIKLKNKHDHNKIKRAESYASFKSGGVLIRYIQSFYPDGHVYIIFDGKGTGKGWKAYGFNGREVKPMYFGKHLKHINQISVDKTIKVQG